MTMDGGRMTNDLTANCLLFVSPFFAPKPVASGIVMKVEI